MKSIFKKALLSSLLLGSGFLASAQGMNGPMEGPGHEGMRAGMHRPDPAKMQEMVTKHLAALKTKLQITPAQEGAWATFSAAMQPPAKPVARPDWNEMQKLAVPERLDKMRAMRAQRQAQIDKRDDAIKAFYAVLSPEQRKVLDAEHRDHERRGPMKDAHPAQ